MTTPVTLTEILAASGAPVRLLLVTPSPLNDPGRLHPETELGHVNAALDEMGVDVDIVRLMPPTIGNLRRALATRRFEIVHVAAHSDHGIEFEDDDGTAITVGEEEFAELFDGAGECLLVLNGCATEGLADHIARSCPQVTTISVAGNIRRRDALRAIDEIYGLLFTRATPLQVAKSASQAVLRRMTARSALAPIQARGRHAGAPLFDIRPGTGRPTYYACAPPANLPPQHRPVIDRTNELLELHGLLFNEHTGGPYVSVMGITGTGKTTIVQAAAIRYGWHFRGGIGYFSLRGSFAVSDLAGVFGWPEADGAMRVEDAALLLAQGRHLLIFDDVDEAAESGIAEIVALLKAWDTSLGGRAILIFRSHRADFQDIIGANWMTVRQLPSDASRELMIACLGGRDKARRAVGADEELSEASRLCLGHPKTIEYAASLLQLGHRWADMRDDLTRLSGEGPLAVNDEMLSRVIAALEERAPVVRDLLDAWLVFEDGARESVWREVAVPDPGRRSSVKTRLDSALNELHGAALIDRREHTGGARCVMHSLLVAHLRRRHARLSGEKMRELVRAQIVQQIRLAEDDHQYPAGETGNIRRALSVAQDLGLWEDVLEFCTVVVGQRELPLVRRGPWPLARDLLDVAVRAAAERADREKEAGFLVVRGMIEYRLAAFEPSARAYEQAARVADEAGARGLRLQALRGVGQVHYRSGDIDTAERVYETARALAGDDEATSDIDHQLAKILYRKGHLDRAREVLATVRRTRESLGRHRDLAKTIHEQARIEQADGHRQAARKLYEEALLIERQVNHPVMEQATLFQLARLSLEMGEAAEAEAFFEGSRRISEELGDQVWIAHAHFGRALLAWNSGDEQGALAHAKEALDTSRGLRIGLTAEIQEWLDDHAEPSREGNRNAQAE